MHFVKVFKDWEPRQIEQSVDHESLSDDTVLGCSIGHPSEVILILIQEISQITSSITESKWIYRTKSSSRFNISYILYYIIQPLRSVLDTTAVPFQAVVHKSARISFHIVLRKARNISPKLEISLT